MLSAVGSVGQNNYNTTFGCKRFANLVREKCYQDELIKMAKQSGKVGQEQIKAMKANSFMSRIAAFFTPVTKQTKPSTVKEAMDYASKNPETCQKAADFMNAVCHKFSK